MSLVEFVEVRRPSIDNRHGHCLGLNEQFVVFRQGSHGEKVAIRIEHFLFARLLSSPHLPQLPFTLKLYYSCHLFGHPGRRGCS